MKLVVFRKRFLERISDQCVCACIQRLFQGDIPSEIENIKLHSRAIVRGNHSGLTGHSIIGFNSSIHCAVLHPDEVSTMLPLMRVVGVTWTPADRCDRTYHCDIAWDWNADNNQYKSCRLYSLFIECSRLVIVEAIFAWHSMTVLLPSIVSWYDFRHSFDHLLYSAPALQSAVPHQLLQIQQ